MIEGDRRSQEALKPGDCLYEKGQESAWSGTFWDAGEPLSCMRLAGRMAMRVLP